jgi:predicted nucleic acid-binding protein
MTPDLIYPEIDNILWKKFRADELSATEVLLVHQGVATVPFRVWPAKELLGIAL